MNEICNAKIKINGFIHECHMDNPFHEGPHVTRIILSESVIGGFEWSLDDSGMVVLDIMDPEVSEILFGKVIKEDEKKEIDEYVYQQFKQLHRHASVIRKNVRKALEERGYNMDAVEKEIDSDNVPF